MAKLKEETSKEVIVKKVNHGGGGAVYGFGLIGALVYYLQHAHTFGQGVLGILKAVVWPALLVYNLLGLLKI